MHELLARLLAWYTDSLQSGGYPGIILLMAMESTVFPLPSEFIIPPAAYLAYSQGHMSLPGVVLAGAFGSWLGATIMYWVSRLAGRPLTLRYGRYVFISPEAVEKAERWCARYGSFGVFASRLLPVVRHLIGIPSGIVRLNYAKYSVQTLLGSLTWCAVLSWVGVLAGNDPALMHGDLTEITLWLAGGVGILGVLYYFLVHRQMRRVA
jgi:membrane protein DedA with SNARE-associated domain